MADLPVPGEPFDPGVQVESVVAGVGLSPQGELKAFLQLLDASDEVVGRYWMAPPSLLGTVVAMLRTCGDVDMALAGEDRFTGIAEAIESGTEVGVRRGR